MCIHRYGAISVRKGVKIIEKGWFLYNIVILYRFRESLEIPEIRHFGPGIWGPESGHFWGNFPRKLVLFSCSGEKVFYTGIDRSL